MLKEELGFVAILISTQSQAVPARPGRHPRSAFVRLAWKVIVAEYQVAS